MDQGFCYSEVDYYAGCASSATDCWDQCEEIFGDDLVAVDAWPSWGCWCQDECQFMVDYGGCDDEAESGCADSSSWMRDGRPDRACDWVAENADKRCEKEDESGVDAYGGCPVTCGTCEDGDESECADSSSWHQDGRPDKACDYVAEKPDKRCEKEDEDDVSAYVGCPATCGTCGY